MSTMSSSSPDSPTSSPSTSPPPPSVNPHSKTPNVFPGGTAHTAGGVSASASAKQDYSFFDAAKTIHLSDFKTLHQKPCVRDALMTGIASGAAIGGGAAVLGRECHWLDMAAFPPSTGSYCVAGLTLAAI